MRDLSPIIPSSIQVVFRTRRCTGTASDQNSIPLFYTKTVDIADVGFTNSDIENLPQGSGDTYTLRSMALALFDANGGVPTNQDSLDALATQIAQDYYDWATTRFDRLYSGVIAPEPNGMADYSEIWQVEEAIVTRYRSQEWNVYAEEFHQNDGPNNANCKDNLTATPPVDSAKTPYVQFASPIVSCAQSVLQVPICKVGIEAGRLVFTYVRTDRVS